MHVKENEKKNFLTEVTSDNIGSEWTDQVQYEGRRIPSQNAQKYKSFLFYF